MNPHGSIPTEDVLSRVEGEALAEVELADPKGEGGHSIGTESWSDPNDQLPSGMGAKDFEVKKG